VWRYALHGPSYRNSVRLSVRHTRRLCPHGSTYDHDFFTVWKPHHSSFWGYHVHPKIRRGSPHARALNEGGVGTNWRFSTNKPPYLRNGARYDKLYYWSLIGNRICAFDWYQNQINDIGWPWNNLGRQLFTPLHYTRVFRSQPLKFAWRQTHTISDKNVAQES